MFRRSTLAFSILVGLLACLSPAQAAVLFSDNFDSGASALWGNEIGAWSAAGGVYSATAPSAVPNASSSLPFDLTDFSIEVDVNDLHDGGIWLRSAAGGAVGRTGVLLVTGGGATGGTGLYWHIVTGGYGSALNVVSNLFVPTVSDVNIRVEVSGDTYSAFVNGSATAATTLTTNAFASGRVALYDFSGQTFDNVILATAVPAPATAALLALGLLGALRGGWRASRRGPPA